MRALLALVAALSAVGCYHDKYNINRPKAEEYLVPPDEPRYNEPDTAGYKPPPPPKQQDTLIGGGNSPTPGGKMGGF
jgi:hypothetical protein